MTALRFQTGGRHQASLGGGGRGGGGKSDGQQSMTWIRMSESWDDVGCSQKDSQGQPGEGELC